MHKKPSGEWIMAYTTIDDPSAFFQTMLHAEDDTAFTFDGNSDLQPDMIWNKNRDENNYEHHIIDSVRGVSKLARVSTTTAEFTSADSITAIGSDGFTTGADNNGYVSSGTDKQVSWCWKESATAGFDIVSYTGNASARTISHNCGAIPTMMIVKKRSDGDNWSVYHQSTGAGNFTILNTSAASAGSSTMWNNTTPTSSVFSLGNKGEVNANGQTFIAYLFADIKGYSKFGSYTGNGNADGTFVYTGFKPAWIMIKNSNSSSEEWNIWDNKRNTFNVMTTRLVANVNAADSVTSAGFFDFTSNGFKIRSTANGVNQSGNKMIYMCFAENPFVTSSEIPTTAR